MRKIVFLILILTLSFSSAIMAKEMTREDILQKLDEISAIENDIARLEAYDKFVSNLSLHIDSSDSSPSSAVGVIAQYSGNGLKNTRPFTTNSAWEIQWDAAGDIFQIYLYNSDGSLVDVAANQMQPGKGSYYSPKAGSFYLQVNAVGNWEVKIVKVN